MQQLVMKRRIDAPMSHVFAAWCKPALIQRWFAPGDMHVPEASADLRQGGRYRIVMQAPDGKQHIVGGEYLAIQPDRALEFTWQWEGSDARTRVRVDLEPSSGGGDSRIFSALTGPIEMFPKLRGRLGHNVFVVLWISQPTDLKS